ncbi:DUF4440 domain-containing protein [Fulvivirgaceae bacterium BMA10]|uniref:DUF4440 domain-containing protein n=1 Tax=Splendidivirga corallicola TaxID=3051826 RepID=A0ABT8KV97_9BACT|nr:DUF4440 domain-containing protein [Fulvivirgaceae bacterium BMA10]
MSKTIFMIMVLSTQLSMAQEPEDLAKSVQKETKAVNDASLKGHLEKNIDKICAAYAADAILLPPGGIEPIMGIEQIRSFYLKSFKQGSVLEVSTKDISFELTAPGHANEIGSYFMIYQNTGSNDKVKIEGNMLIVWEQDEHGEWKIKWDMWH